MDINCDMGESFGNFSVGNDEGVFPYITSCNIACGFHGGDPFHMQKTIQRALKLGVRIGAHPSYPDLAGFGRRKMEMSNDELKAVLKYQISALKGMVESEGGQVEYVKPHGALYNSVAWNIEEAQVVIEAIQEIDPNLSLMGLANSLIVEEVRKYNLNFIAEAFADRKYLSDGQLMSRNHKGSVLEEPKLALEQVKLLVEDGKVIANDGDELTLQADSICIHGDNQGAVDILIAINDFFKK